MKRYVFDLETNGLVHELDRVHSLVIRDADTNEPLIAANVIVQNTAFGAATDLDGSYYIINIKPGTYTLVVDMIGYKQLRLENVRVSVNRTTTIDANLESTVIQGETVIVEVDAIRAIADGVEIFRAGKLVFLIEIGIFSLIAGIIASS